jgi:hypothetical protein
MKYSHHPQISDSTIISFTYKVKIFVKMDVSLYKKNGSFSIVNETARLRVQDEEKATKSQADL